MALTKGIAKAKGHSKNGGNVKTGSAKGYHSIVGGKSA
jgi:hypothetical protein